MRRTGTVLICDDELGFREMVVQTLAAEGHQMLAAGTLRAAREILAGVAPDILLLDLVLPDGNGVELLREVPDLAPGCLCLVLTAQASFRTAVDALRLGAFDYLEKPLRLEDLVARTNALLAHRATLRENAMLRKLVEGHPATEGLVVKSAALQAALDLAKRVATRGRTVLLTGESGVGKEEFARFIHAVGPDSAGPFVPVNLAALPEPLAEAQLFGHAKGAFTGAERASDGLARAASGGSLFLDEIGDAPMTIQAKLLRFVDRSEVLAVGSTSPIRVSCRIIAATNRDLAAEVAARRFREDLFHRLNVVRIEIPPLRERRDGIPQLVRHLVARLALDRVLPEPVIQDDAMSALVAYSWPGNVRELRNVIERALILGSGQQLTLDDLPDPIRHCGARDMAPMDLRAATQAFERQHIERAIAASQGDRRAAARNLGIALSTLYGKLGS
jgi:DNA-binding NtrC family response regulator